MGILQKDSLKTTIISYLGLAFGYLNKGFLFFLFFSTEQIGLVNLLLSVGLLFGQLSNLGLMNTIWRFFPFLRNEEKEHYGFLKFSLLVVLVGCLFFAILSIALKSQIVFLYQEKSILFVHYFYWIIPIGVANVLFLVAEMYLRGLYKNTISVFVNEFVHRLLLTLLLFLFGFKIISFEYFVLLFALSYFLPPVILLTYLHKLKELKFTKTKIKIPGRLLKILYSFSMFSYINTLGGVVVISMDAMMIASFMGLKATGVYTSILYFISALQIPHRSIARVGISLVARHWKEKNMSAMKELYWKVSSISNVIALYSFLLVWINIDPLVSFLPKDFETVHYALLFLLIGKTVDVFFGLNAFILITSKKYKYDIIFTVTLLILVFIMNYFLIPIYGIAGAAISYFFGIFLYNVGRSYFVWKCYKLHPFEIKQLYVIVLFLAILVVFHFLPVLATNRYLLVLLNSVIITVVFVGTVIKLKWNQDLNQYANKLVRRLFKIELKVLQ